MTPGDTAVNKALLPHWKSRQLFVAIAIALIVWLLDFSGALPALDDMGYDACLRVTSAASTAPAHVLLVYVDRKNLTDGSDVPESLARALLELGARKIGFTCTLSEPSTELVKLTNETRNIFLARKFRANPIDPDELEFSPTSAAASNLPLGLVGLSPESNGVYRSHFGGLLVEGSWQPSLEAIIAREVLLDHKTIPDNGFRVAFRG